MKKGPPRDYQQVIVDALEKYSKRRIIAFMPRRSGKNWVALYILMRQAIKEAGIYYWVDFNCRSRHAFFEEIPKDNYVFCAQENKLVFINGSVVHFVKDGKDIYQSLRIMNSNGIVLSEYAMHKHLKNDDIFINDYQGWMLFITTPRKTEIHHTNNATLLWNKAKELSSWFCYKVTIQDTKQISVEQIKKEIDASEITQDCSDQDYYCKTE